MAPDTITIDVTGRIPLEGRHHVAIQVFAPDASEGPVPLLFCLPGGTYSKAYWHLEVPGRSSYSFAEHLAAQGMLIVTVDHIGTGESSRHPKAVELTPDVVAGTNSVVLSEVVAHARAGKLVPDTKPLETGPVVGVGHSMGAMLAIFQQSLYGDMDAIAALGYGTIGPIIDFGVEGISTGVPTYESVMALARTGALDDLRPVERPKNVRNHFYWDDVPDDVIAADDLAITEIPGVTGLLSIVPFIASDHAGRIRSPVFIGLGQRDSTPDAHEEPRAYRSSNDVTWFLLERSAHCHNSASTRHLLWDRLGRWIRSLPETTENR